MGRQGHWLRRSQSQRRRPPDVPSALASSRPHYRQPACHGTCGGGGGGSGDGGDDGGGGGGGGVCNRYVVVNKDEVQRKFSKV